MKYASLVIILVLMSAGFWYFYQNNENKRLAEIEIPDPYMEDTKVLDDVSNVPKRQVIDQKDDVASSAYNTSENSRKDHITTYEDKPVGYSNPNISNIVGYNTDIGAVFNIPAGVEPSLVEDGSLKEVWAIRFEDKLAGEYNDAFAVFSCFENDSKNMPYVTDAKIKESSIIQGKNGPIIYEDFGDYFILKDIEKVNGIDLGDDIVGCGLVLSGISISEVHVTFMKDINYIESRSKYLQNISSLFKEMYINKN